MIRLENIAKRYGDGPEVLRDLSLELPPGSFHFLTGAIGAGKTTLLSILALAERPSRGTVTLFDTQADAASRRIRAGLRRRIGVVFQELRLAEDISVAENIALPLRVDGAGIEQCSANVAALLAWLGIADKSNAFPAALSGSERLRVALARALVRRPDLLLADDPLAAGGEEEVALLLVDAFERMTQLGTTVLVATRNLGFADHFPHPRLHLDGGTLSTNGAAA